MVSDRHGGPLDGRHEYPPVYIGGKAIGKRFFFGSLVGMLSMAGFLDLFVAIPAPQTDPILGALYGGVITGVGMGLVFLSGVSSGERILWSGW